MPSKIRVKLMLRNKATQNSLSWRHQALIWWRFSALVLFDNTRHTPEPHSPPKTVQMKSFLIVIKKSSSTKKKLRNVTKTKLTEMKLKSMVPARQLFSIPPLIIIAQSRTCCNFQSELSNRRLISDEIRETRNRWRQCGENFFSI